jgi:outer membrane protein assembly factor BamB
MKSKINCILFCSVMLINIFIPIVQNVTGPNTSTSGTGGLTDSPWPMFSCNAQRTGLSAYDTSGNPGKLKWDFSISYWIQSSPIIDSDGIIYISDSKNNLYAINPDGIEKWNISISGITQTPAIDSYGTIYVGSSDNIFYAINQNGTEKWHFGTDEPVNSSPAIGSDGTIYFGTSSGVNSYHLFYALNPDGTEKWRFRINIGGQTSSPGIGLDGTIYFGSSDNNLYAINPDGTEKWRFTSATDNVQSAPAIDSDGTIYVGSRDSNLYAINPDGSEKWRFTTGGAIGWSTSAAIGPDGTIYIDSGDNCLYALNPDGTEKWIYTIGGGFTTPSIGSEGTIYVGGHDYNLYSINPDGTEKWHFTTGYIVNLSPSIGSDGTIYVCSDDHKLYAIGPPPPIHANIDIDPDTLNLKSRGRWITCYIDLPGYDVNNIDISTILLEDAIPAEWGDVQGTTLMVKFDRGEVEDYIGVPQDVIELWVTGEFYDGTEFEGSDTIRVIYPP